MKDNEIVGDYFSKVMDNVGRQRSYGEDLTDKKIVKKFLKSLSQRFDSVTSSIEVTSNLAALTPVKLRGLLHSQEEKLNSRAFSEKTANSQVRQDEQALQVFADQNRSSRGMGRGRGTTRGRGRSRRTFDRSKVPQCIV
uniref:uncharacterized protein LOC122609357 n=1 Tax=Erigeron canadensis TaxID=72917 RepID=UPI001CB964AD|nr:uncharacterized protein LOC122609357 [Erigeron canadensis]